METHWDNHSERLSWFESRRSREVQPFMYHARNPMGGDVGHLERRGLLRYFEFVLSEGDVSNVKPDPELYATAARRLGVRPRDALAIEDSANGLAAAKSAGLYCVVVPNPMTEDMDFDSADIRLNSLSDVPLENLIKELRRRSADPIG